MGKLIKFGKLKIKIILFFCFNVSFFIFYLNFYCYSITVVCLFSPSLTSPQPNPPPSPASTLPLDFVHVSFIVAPVNPSPHYPLPTPLWLLLDLSLIHI